MLSFLLDTGVFQKNVIFTWLLVRSPVLSVVLLLWYILLLQVFIGQGLLKIILAWLRALAVVGLAGQVTL